MSARFSELDWRPTPMGDISLRRRWDPLFERDVYEIKLGDEFLMSSLFTVAEVELARLALAALPTAGLDVLVGGLGLGYTALTVLEDPAVRSLVVIEALPEVIEWHRRGLIPAGPALLADPRTELLSGDFFGIIRADPDGSPGPAAHPLLRRFHAIVVDIDHSPVQLLHPSHADFYQPSGLERLAGRLHPGGVFALWSNDPPDDNFLATLTTVFAEARAEVVSFANPIQGHPSTNTVYLATVPDGD